MQLTFSEAEYHLKKRKTRREKFLEQMDKLIPWERLEKRIEPFYPKAGRGRQPYPLAKILRVHCLQLFYNLSDPGMEDALYEIESMRVFAGLSLSQAIPDETTILNFRRFGRCDSKRSESTPGITRLATERRNHCGCQHYLSPALNQESSKGTRPRDASNEERR